MTSNADSTLDTATKLKQIAELSQRKPEEVFNNIIHLFNQQSLRECFYELEGRKAVGADGISKDDHKGDLYVNLF